MKIDVDGYQLTRAADKEWEKGLRGFFSYRDLGLSQATRGAFHAHIIRADEAISRGTGKHKHDVSFHWTHVIKGWISFEFQGVGQVRLEAGDSQWMPYGIHHELNGCSDDLEMIEMHSPGEIGDKPVEDWNKK